MDEGLLSTPKKQKDTKETFIIEVSEASGAGASPDSEASPLQVPNSESFFYPKKPSAKRVSKQVTFNNTTTEVKDAPSFDDASNNSIQKAAKSFD